MKSTSRVTLRHHQPRGGVATGDHFTVICETALFGDGAARYYPEACSCGRGLFGCSAGYATAGDAERAAAMATLEECV